MFTCYKTAMYSYSYYLVCMLQTSLSQPWQMSTGGLSSCLSSVLPTDNILKVFRAQLAWRHQYKE